MPASFDEQFEVNAMPQLKQQFGVQVTLTRGVAVTEEFTAVFENRTHQITDKNGTVTYVRTRDFLLPAADLVLNSVTIRPQKGDRITEVESGEVHEIVPVGNRPPVDLQAGNYNWLAHTQRVSGPN